MARAVEGLMERFGVFRVLLLEFVATAEGITAAVIFVVAVEEIDRKAKVDERTTRKRWICLSARGTNSLWARKQDAMVVYENRLIELGSQLSYATALGGQMIRFYHEQSCHARAGGWMERERK